jgi:hypothetical protein
MLVTTRPCRYDSRAQRATVREETALTTVDATVQAAPDLLRELDVSPEQRIARTFADYFRSPIDLVRFGQDPQPAGADGFFAFGPEAICYGKHARALPTIPVDGPLADLAAHARVEGQRVVFPFDFPAVVENLRRERYHARAIGRSQQFLAGALARSIYYFLRPILSVPVRKHLQKARLKGWEQIAFPRWPVDVSVDRLMQDAMRLAVQAQATEAIPFIWFWPEGAPSAAIVTHDVESAAGCKFAGGLMDIDDDAGIKSSFQIVPTERYEHPERLAGEVRSRGFEVNVHDLNHDGALFQDKKEFMRRARLVNEFSIQFASSGFRSGAMYRNQEWFDAFEFSYDMSVPNVAHLEPQGGGCCTVMPYFVGNILELPLTTTQDYSLFHILNSHSTELWREQIERIHLNHGLISVLSHPDYLLDAPEQQAYRELLAHLSERRKREGIWIALPREVDGWWRLRHHMRLVRNGDDWRIEGPGSDRARIAFATVAGGQLVYTIGGRRDTR